MLLFLFLLIFLSVNCSSGEKAMKYTAFDEYRFRQAVDRALQKAKTILEVNRSPRYAQDQDHSFEDKYALAEFLTNTAIASQVNIFERMGLSRDKLGYLCDAVQQERRSVTLCYGHEQTCTFLKEEKVSVVVSDDIVTVETTKNTPRVFGTNTRKTKESVQHKVKKMVQEYHWKISTKQNIFCFVGNNPSMDRVEIWSRESSTVIITTGSKDAPFEERTTHQNNLSLTWLLQNIMESDGTPKDEAKKKNKERLFACSFKIDRNDKEKCRTPRRNPNIEGALGFYFAMRDWSSNVRNYMRTRIEWTILGAHNPAKKEPSNKSSGLSSVQDEDVFCPVLPLFEQTADDDVPETTIRQEHSKSLLLLEPVLSSESGMTSSPLISVGDAEKFLNEQCRSLDCALESLGKTFPSPPQLDKLITAAEAALTLLLASTESLQFLYSQGIEYIEDMLSKQVIAAIGKEVKAKDFDEFMSFHNKKLFAREYSPKPFCYAIRRPNHYPDGILTIERKGKGGASEGFDPVETIVNCIPGGDDEGGPPISIPINAATSVMMTGPRYLHGWICHDFAGDTNSNIEYQLTARARQFSSFLVVVGVMAGPDSFHPKDAIILQNKDEILIPLLLNQLPTAKEFKDAISSLSPEQQQFAQSFRGMQLESSVFGVCVIQLKPQLEVLLGLPQGALTKEIRLTQDLMTLFVEHQIPSDLLSFDGLDESPKHEKLKQVKDNVKAVVDVIDAAKKEELVEVERKAEIAVASAIADRIDDLAELEVGHASGFFEDGDFLEEERKNKVRKKHKKKRSRGSVSGRSLAIDRERSVDEANLRWGSGSAPLVVAASSQVDDAFAVLPQTEAPMKMKESSFEEGTEVALPATTTKTDETDHGDLMNLLDNQEHSRTETDEANALEGGKAVVDFTSIPKELDTKFERHDTDSSLRATILETKKDWKMMRQQHLLSKVKSSMLSSDDIRNEKNKAFDLLDALSRSGSLPLSCAELHVVVAVTHCFDNDVMGTAIQDNINPIEKVERSTMMVASTIHGCARISDMISNEVDRLRLSTMFPALMNEG